MKLFHYVLFTFQTKKIWFFLNSAGKIADKVKCRHPLWVMASLQFKSRLTERLTWPDKGGFGPNETLVKYTTPAHFKATNQSLQQKANFCRWGARGSLIFCCRDSLSSAPLQSLKTLLKSEGLSPPVGVHQLQTQRCLNPGASWRFEAEHRALSQLPRIPISHQSAGVNSDFEVSGSCRL